MENTFQLTHKRRKSGTCVEIRTGEMQEKHIEKTNGLRQRGALEIEEGKKEKNREKLYVKLYRV